MQSALLYCTATFFQDDPMLYQIYDMQRSLMEPFADLALTASKVFTNPLMPLSHLPNAQRISASSFSHWARNSGLFNTAATMAPPCVGGLE